MLGYIFHTLPTNYISIIPSICQLDISDHSECIRYRHQFHSLDIVSRLTLDNNRDALIALAQQHVRYNNVPRSLWINIPEELIFEAITPDITSSQAKHLFSIIVSRFEPTIITTLTACKLGYYLSAEDKEELVAEGDIEMSLEMLYLEPKVTLIEYIECMPQHLLRILFDDVFSLHNFVSPEFNYPVVKAIVDRLDAVNTTQYIVAHQSIYDPLNMQADNTTSLGVIIYHIEHLGLSIDSISKYIDPAVRDSMIDQDIMETYIHKITALMFNTSIINNNNYIMDQIHNAFIIDDCYFCSRLRI